jgi:hypothetical protein
MFNDNKFEFSIKKRKIIIIYAISNHVIHITIGGHLVEFFWGRGAIIIQCKITRRGFTPTPSCNA